MAGYDSGGSAAGQSLGFIDKAETFGESGLSVSHTNTEASSGTLGLQSNQNSTANVNLDDSYSTSSSWGVRINPNSPLHRIDYSVSSNTGGIDGVQLVESDGTIIAESNNRNDSFTGLSLSAGTDYGVECQVSSGITQRRQISPPDFTSEHIDVLGGSRNGGTFKSDVFNIDSVTGYTKPTSGSAYLTWGLPNDLLAWDRIVFREIPDGETVGLYIEEDQSGSWTEIAGPIASGDSIPADSANDVRLRVDLSRADTANDPQLEAAYRRYLI